MRIQTLYILLILGLLNACGPDLPPELEKEYAELPDQLDFNIHIKPILSDRCYACHGPDANKREAGLRLDLPETAFSELPENPGKYAIKAGKPAGSELFHRMLSDDSTLIMPPPSSNLSLTKREKAILIKWIQTGAEYKPHWAFIPPQKPRAPKVEKKDWGNNLIDQFVLAKLEENGLQPSPEADKESLLRRLYLDLTGLPPTAEEVKAFIADASDNAYEERVDQLLASPHYGEKMATDWMDLARYADTHGYTVDRYRPMWPWRDWVIDAFNQNMPYDTFVLWQLAGDLLPERTREQRLATAFNRNHPQNMEGGIINEEFRVEYVADRTTTFGTAFMGLTLQCARCHDHKYDPISQREFYELYSFFNNVDEAGQISWDNATPVPTMFLEDKEIEEKIAFLDQEINKLDQSLEQQLSSKRIQLEADNVDREQLIKEAKKSRGLVAYFDLDKKIGREKFANRLDSKDPATIVTPVLVKGKKGNGIKLNGDDPLKLGKAGIFGRADAFSIGLWVNLPEEISDGMIIHKGDGAIIYNWRGYHLALRDHKLEILMANTWPYNAIIELAKVEVPRNAWVHLMMTYDGRGKAEGFKVYMNGEELKTVVEKDNLYKDILFDRENEPGLKVGARWRGKGIAEAIVDEIKVYDRTLSDLEVSLLAKPDERSFAENVWKEHQLLNSPEIAQTNLKILSKETQKLELLKELKEIMVMEEMPEPRASFILERGQYDAYGEAVNPATPNRVLAFPDSLPPNRLGLAKWLFYSENPLFSRVSVNRYWQMYFGQGLVKSTEDFGNQGNLPSHPLLLDALAVYFMENKWDVKALQKLIVMSATYRQSSLSSEQLIEIDPDNTLLARGPSRRLTAEMLRDQALAASGLLVRTIGGESVKPYQPNGLWSFGGSGKYEQGKGEELYRRSMYTFWKRTILHPSLNTLDAPDRSYCVVRRQETSTPLQALVVMNDPQFVEASRALAEKVLISYPNLSEGLEHIYLALTGRSVEVEELEILERLYQSESEKFVRNPEKLKGWIAVGEHSTDTMNELHSLAAMTVVVSAVMNTDASLMVR